MFRTIFAIIGVVLSIAAVVLGYKNKEKIKVAYDSSDLKNKVLTKENKQFAYDAAKATVGFGWAVTKGAAHLVYNLSNAALTVRSEKKAEKTDVVVVK